MPRRIEVELTSTRDDGSWTWRAAGARQPKGTLDGSLLFAGAKVGDVIKADAEFDVDGIDIVSVIAPKGSRREPERIELLGTTVSDDQLVITTLAPRGRNDRRDDDGRRKGGGGRGRPRSDRGDRPDGGSPRSGGRDGGRSDRPARSEHRPAEGGDTRTERPRRTERRPRPAAPVVPEKPKPKRLRPLRHHRNAVLADLPESERPIAEQVLRGGVPAVRQAVDKQNEQAKADGQPLINAEPLVAMAERLLPRLRTAEWRDRADAALATIDDLDLRDLRSVVVAADSAARDDETRELATSLREGLNRRVEEEHRAWLAELHETMTAGRTVRALRLSSRPPKAGAPIPGDMAAKLAEAAGAAFGADVTQERWATVLDAVAYSPVRQSVTPAAYPETPSDELLAAVRKLASRVPAIAQHFGIEATEAPKRGRRAPGKGTKVPAPPPHPSPAATTAIIETDEPNPSAEPVQAEHAVVAAEAPAEASAVAVEVADAVEAAVVEAEPTVEPEPMVEAEPTVEAEPEAAAEPEVVAAEAVVEAEPVVEVEAEPEPEPQVDADEPAASVPSPAVAEDEPKV